MHFPSILRRACALAVFALPLGAQTPAAPKPSKPSHLPIFVDPTRLDLSLILPPPPTQNSPTARAELAEIHRIERTRTPTEVAAAEFDDLHEDIFLFAPVLGPSFNAAALPETVALSAHLSNDAALIDGPLKKLFRRPRPYNFDSTLHPICETNQEKSYPSGHSLNGFLFAFALAQIVPEKHTEILARADAYAHNRLVCEAHYPSDLEASRRVALALFGYIAATPRFASELAAARTETRTALHLSTP